MPLYCIPTPDIDGVDHIGIFHPNFFRLDVEDEHGKTHTWVINAQSSQEALQRMECVITPDSLEDERTVNFLLSLSRETRKVWLPSDYDSAFMTAAARMAGYKDMRISGLNAKEIPQLQNSFLMVVRPNALEPTACKLSSGIRHFFSDALEKGISPIEAGQNNMPYQQHLRRHSAYVETEQRRRALDLGLNGHREDNAGSTAAPPSFTSSVTIH